MPYTPVELMLVKGLPSSKSLGSGLDLTPTVIDLLSGVFTVFDDNGKSTFSPVIATIKDGGVWVDSATMDGRQLVAAKRGNVIEVVRLRASSSYTVMQRANALSEINFYASAASDYWSNNGVGDPVYLRFQAPGAPGEQYALIYSIEVDDDDDGLNPEGNGEMTITIERESAWRGIAPGMSPKVWAMLAAGQEPSTTDPAPAGHFTYTNLSLTSAGVGANSHLLQATCKRVDEVGTTQVNYVTVPADDIPGDAPALAWIHAQYTGTPTKVYFSRSIARDFYPTVNTNVANQKMRNTFNGGDSTLVGGGGLTASKQVDATYGVFSNGSGVTRYILRAANLAAGFAETTWATWLRTINHYLKRWAVFARIRLTAGTAASHTLRIGMRIQNQTVYTSPRTLTGLTATPALLYLGELDASQFSSRAPDGVGSSSTFAATISALLTKANDGAASTIEVVDLIFLPIDEPTLKITGSLQFNVSADSTQYFSLVNRPYGLTNGALDRADAQGQEILLQPKVDNRIYYLDDFIAAGYQTTDITFYIDIVPRWYGIRNV